MPVISEMNIAAAAIQGKNSSAFLQVFRKLIVYITVSGRNPRSRDRGGQGAAVDHDHLQSETDYLFNTHQL